MALKNELMIFSPSVQLFRYEKKELRDNFYSMISSFCLMRYNDHYISS
jgi:hypothetical protein